MGGKYEGGKRMNMSKAKIRDAIRYHESRITVAPVYFKGKKG